MNDEFTREAVALSLRKMFKEHYFSICTVESALEALNLHPPKGQLQSLRPIHCVHWSEMTPEFRQQVMQRVLALFADAQGFDLDAVDHALGVPINQGMAIGDDGPAKRKSIGLSPFRRRA